MSPSQFDREARSAALPQSRGSLLASGVSDHELRTHWRRTSHGLYAPIVRSGTGPASREVRDLVDGERATTLVSSTTQRILDASPLVPPGGAIGGWSAAFVHGVDTLDGQHSIRVAANRLRGSLSEPIVICLPLSLHRRSTPEVSYLRTALTATEVCRREGLVVTSRLRTIFDATRSTGDLTEAVAVLDACLYCGLATSQELATFALQHASATSADLVRKALAFADPAARNLWESRLRLFCMSEAGLPRPLVNQPVFHHGGTLLGLPDLLFEEAGCAVEFDGRYHRERRQHRADNIREELLEHSGLVVVRVDSLDLLHHRPELVRRLRAAYGRGLGRNRELDRWTLARRQ